MQNTNPQQNDNQEKITEQLLQSVSEAYLNPPEGLADKDGHMKISELGAQFSMTWMKIRKLLITAGVYENPMSVQINKLKSEGKSVKEIQDITGLSPATISGYLPYQKTIYNLEQQSELAERLKRCRKRKKAVENLSIFLNSGIVTEKAKSVTKSTVNMAFEKVIQLQNENISITGSRRIGCFGDSYLYPLFVRFGIIRVANNHIEILELP